MAPLQYAQNLYMKHKKCTHVEPGLGDLNKKRLEILTLDIGETMTVSTIGEFSY